MPIRQTVQNLVSAGPLPSEQATVSEIEATQRLLELVTAPLSDEEAQMLLAIFGPDDCFGLAWTVLHLIETAPSALTAKYSQNADNQWVKLLEQRRSHAAGHGATRACPGSGAAGSTTRGPAA
jgi:hypothetical protein